MKHICLNLCMFVLGISSLFIAILLSYNMMVFARNFGTTLAVMFGGELEVLLHWSHVLFLVVITSLSGGFMYMNLKSYQVGKTQIHGAAQEQKPVGRSKIVKKRMYAHIWMFGLSFIGFGILMQLTYNLCIFASDDCASVIDLFGGELGNLLNWGELLFFVIMIILSGAMVYMDVERFFLEKFGGVEDEAMC